MRPVKLLVLLLSLVAISSCKKTLQAKAENYFEKNVLNRNFAITYAIDEGDVITNAFSGYIFILHKGADYYGGDLTVMKGTESYTGSWQSNEDFGKLTIQLPGTPTEFKFLTRDWRFTSKKIPVLKFAPWGSDANTAITMERQ